MGVAALPVDKTADGSPRRVGIEVECSGLTEDAVTRLIVETLGGSRRQVAEYEWRVEDTCLGGMDVLLDTALRDWAGGAVKRAGLDLGRAVIPVEYVSDPILPTEIRDLERLNAAMAEAGAFGTQDGIALGFGVHLNVALAGTTIPDILPTLQTFALVEDWLRADMAIDTARRVLPFVDPYSAELVDALAAPEADAWTLEQLIEAYLTHAPSRNRALDVLPILKHLDHDRVVAAVPEMARKAGRPAWHYRLPDCRIDDPDWSLSLEWGRWCAIERIAADRALLDRLREEWRAYRGRIHLPGQWARISGEIIGPSGAFL